MSSHSLDRPYEHNIRCLVPLLPIADLLADGSLNDDQLREVRRYDGLINFMYLPAHEVSAMPESLAALFLTVPIEHGLLLELATRVTQLAPEGAKQLQRKLVWYISSVQLDRRLFQPPMD